MMELSGKDVKTDHVNMPHMFQKIEENRSMVRRELEHIETSQIGYPEMKNIVSEMKNTLNGINCRLKYTEESVSDLESMAIKYQKWSTQIKKYWKYDINDSSKHSNTDVIRVKKNIWRYKGIKFCKFDESYKSTDTRKSRNPSSTNLKDTTLKKIILNWWKTVIKKKILKAVKVGEIAKEAILTSDKTVFRI